MTFLWRSSAYSHPCLFRFNQARSYRLWIPEAFQWTNFSTGALSSGGQILLRAWMNSKVFLLALKRVSLNSATDMPVHSVLNISHGVISTTFTIEGVTYRYIMRRITITTRGLLSIRSRFCSVFFPKDVPACFGFTPITKCTVWNWRLTAFPLCCRLEIICRYKSCTSFSAMGTFPRKAFSPLRKKNFGGMTVQ